MSVDMSTWRLFKKLMESSRLIVDAVMLLVGCSFSSLCFLFGNVGFYRVDDGLTHLQLSVFFGAELPEGWAVGRQISHEYGDKLVSPVSVCVSTCDFLCLWWVTGFFFWAASSLLLLFSLVFSLCLPFIRQLFITCSTFQ